MQRTISKNVNISIQLNYTEVCNLLIGGLVHMNMHITDLIPDSCLDDIEDGKIKNIQINITVDEISKREFGFVKQYLKEKEKHEARSA